MLATSTTVTLKALQPAVIVDECLTRHEDKLSTINKQIHDNPELKYEEFQAHDNICDLMESFGYQVERHAYGIDTSFEVEYGHGGRLVVFNAEYDALPGIGHACGHNLIATSSIAAFIATAESIKATGIAGRVRLLGTPAEESGGGKIKLINANAYKGVDACLMAHPGPSDRTQTGGMTANDGLAAMKTLARKQVRVTFTGQNAHAGLAPWQGRNALDAVVSSYVNISLLRQQMPPSARVHGVIRHGGKEPNIIPDSATLEYFVRDTSAASVASLANKIESCFQAGAQATGCTVETAWISEADYKDLMPNMALARSFTEHMTTFGKNYEFDARYREVGASTDMGNVCYEVPGFHCSFSVGGEVPDASPHSPAFEKAAATRGAFANAIACAKGMALTAFDVLAHDTYAEEVRKEFEDTFATPSQIHF